MSLLPAGWIEEVSQCVLEMQQIPLWGSVPPFPWEKVTALLAKALQAEGLEMSAPDTQVRQASELLSGLGAQPLAIALTLSPLAGELFWVMSREDLSRIASLLLTTEGEMQFTDLRLQEGFYRFLILSAIREIQSLHPWDDLALKLAQERELPQEEAMCLDVPLRIQEHPLWGRLICPLPLLHTLRAHFAHKGPSYAMSERAKQERVELHIQAGTTSMPLQEWNQMAVGDLLVLDRCTLDPKTHKGTVTIALNQKPLFQARLKESHLTILDFAYHEEEETMNEEDEAFDGEAKEETMAEAIEAEDTEEQQEHLWAKGGEQPPLDTLVAAAEVPLTLTVEVGRLHVTMQKLLELQPGNVLELPVRPEQGVFVMLSGKRVAKGELIRIGEVLGVRILKVH